jgi:hypothetical protein
MTRRTADRHRVGHVKKMLHGLLPKPDDAGIMGGSIGV